MPPHTDGSMVFTTWRHCAPPPNICFLGNRSPNTKRHLDRFSRFLHNSWQTLTILYNGPPLFQLKNCPFLWGIWTPVKYVVPLAHLSPQPKQNVDRLSHFCTAHCRMSLYFTMGRPFLLKIAPSHAPSRLASNARFFGPTTQTAS